MQRADSLYCGRADNNFDIALMQTSTNEYSAAADELEKAIKLDPKPAFPHVLLGRAYQNTNRSLQAVEKFQKELMLEPGIPLGHYHLGFAYGSLGRSQEAIVEFRNKTRR